MAGGKLSPRQKMINLMYLVFIAMLALNMSKEVLSAFGLLNEKISDANQAATERNVAFMDGLATKASDEPEQYAAVEAKAKEISAITSEFDAYMQGLKAGAVETIEDPTDYEVMDKPDHFNNLFFTGENLKPEGQKFIDQMNKYRTEMVAILSDTAVAKKVAGANEIIASINDTFGTGEVEKSDGTKQDWLNYHYEGFPLIASLTKMTSLQNDVKTNQSEILQKMLSGQQAAALSFSNYSTIMDVEKSAYYSGETFNGAILLGRTDASTVPQEVNLTLDGRPLTEDQYTVQGGKVVLNVGAGSPGDHKIEGTLVYGEGGEKVEVPVKTGFATISKPNAAVIAADKMNVVYRGVDNPMTVSIPGIPDNNVSASATGLSKISGSKYVMRPGAGREVTITASGTLPDGQRISTPAKFRIKDIPAPQGAVRGETGIVRMQRNGLEIASISAVLPDFDFDVNLQVTGFSFKVSGQPTVRVNGTRLDGAAKGALRRAKRGDAVQIFDINAKVQGSSVVLKKTSPVIIELTN
ncbi:MAG: gliding motility protein GldM [Flavobacteriaceae bacterium]|nr:gliding motility protein GldM [Flavobacteriaceae bacterium]|tara:strand:+ start:8478 stop:10052 length:1575 start_codon:yes stop_codon:yes gene_type:complete